MSERTIRVYEVLYDTGLAGDGGPAADGHAVYRTRSKRDAEAWARRRECYGRPSSVATFDAPPRLARRWGLA